MKELQSKEYYDFITTKQPEDFTPSEIKILSNRNIKIIKKNLISFNINTELLFTEIFIRRIIDEYYTISIISTEKRIEIRPSKDQFILCDQFDEVIHWLKNNFEKP